MNIALITPYFPDEHTIDSGIANHYRLLAESLAVRGNRIVVIHVRGRYDDEQEAFGEYELSPNITVLTFKVKAPALVLRLFKNKWAIIDAALKLKCMRVTSRSLNKIIKQYNIDVIETSSYFSLCYFTLHKKIKAPLAVRVSTTFSQMMKEHYPFKSRGMDLIAAMEIAFIKKSKHLITHAYSHAEEIGRLYGINANRFDIIPHGVNLPETDAYKKDHSTIKVLYTGRLEYRKGTDVLLAAIPLVLKENPGILFELIGHDPNNQYQTWFEQDNEERILRQVIFRGRIASSDLADAYRNCDIFVAPSRYESFGIIFIEAMSYGKPVIGCEVGGVPDIIADNYNGLFADTADAQSLADRILTLAADEALREQMGANARKTVENKFTGQKLASNSLKYYQTLQAQS
ncbi:glycosyltransferase family 4 protein [Mucilaginibacter celer]|uniref:Glycosyltransferase n=1 Tax=Mucilaginibacter celer TaxID=2305508 RepID=A0A494VQU7_9SPHI|nr:glycosyltransferase family 4 protein [Mucilaginibacter celer]AYL97254.1 glycosyltransferase [Mucilaginibacter celer]